MDVVAVRELFKPCRRYKVPGELWAPSFGDAPLQHTVVLHMVNPICFESQQYQAALSRAWSLQARSGACRASML